MTMTKPMTVGDLISLLHTVPQDSLICVPSPDGTLVPNEALYIERKQINWWGDVVFIKCHSWRLYPKNDH